LKSSFQRFSSGGDNTDEAAGKETKEGHGFLKRKGEKERYLLNRNEPKTRKSSVSEKKTLFDYLEEIVR